MPSPIVPLLESISKKGIVLPNKYVIDFTWPTLMDKVGFGLMREMDQDKFFRVTEVYLAGRNITSFPETNIYGPIRETPEGIRGIPTNEQQKMAQDAMKDFYEDNS